MMTRRWMWLPFVCAGLMVCTAETWAQAPVDPLLQQVEQAVAKAKPSIVRIKVVEADFYDGREQKNVISGSGVIIRKDGYAVTNHHVAGHATRMFCTLANKEEVEAELVGTDPLTDIAVIKLKDGREYTPAAFGDSNALRPGQPVLALGSPMALSQSVTRGIVSNTEMVMPDTFGGNRMDLDGEDVGTMVRWIGHDAFIYGGNSGGPLVNLNGDIVGINEIRMALSGAIPGNLARSVAEAIIDKKKVSRSWLGVEVQPLLKSAGVSEGVLVSTVIDGAPAADAGIRSGDIILRIAGEPVTARFREQLPDFNRRIADLPIGQETEFVILRDGKETPLRVKTTEREEAFPRQHEFKAWGFTARNLSFFLAKNMKRESRDGVLVTSLRPGGPSASAKPELKEKDVLVEVAGKPVKSLADLEQVTAEITRGQSAPVPTLVGFERKTGKYVTVIKVGVEEIQDPGLEVRKAWLPVDTQVLTRDIATQLERKDLMGFRVTQVYPSSTAEQAGLRVGDVIYAVDGERLTASAPENYEELPALIRQYKIGATTELSVLRGKEEIKIAVVLAESPKLSREMKKYRDPNFDFAVRDITFFDRNSEKWTESKRGVLVEEVTPGGWAAVGKLNVGDLIVRASGEPVESVEQIEAVMAGLKEKKPQVVVFEVTRGISTMFLELEPNWNE